MKLAFYAPMKAPDHPVPSGDRRMAQLLWAALERAGFTPELASDFRAFDSKGDPDRQIRLKTQGEAEAAKLIEKWTAHPSDAPQGWFTYHLYHKAPDWIGPAVCRALDIPYFVAEASHAPKRAGGPWQTGYAAAEAAIRSARVIFHMTALDGACLAPLIGEGGELVLLPPFLDLEVFEAGAVSVDTEAEILKASGTKGKTNLLAVAMMRRGDKLQSYQALGHALALLGRDDWQLLVIGDGEAEDEVRDALNPIGAKAVYLGRRPIEELPVWYAAADLYVWPAVNEAYGMAFLEAEACGLPVVAGRVRGVPDVVRDGETALLTPPDDPGAFANAVSRLLDDPGLRDRMGRAARAFVHEERGLDAAADLLKRHMGRWL